MPAELAGPKPTCYVCSETPLWLEVNTSTTKLRDIVEKIVRSKLSVNSPIIMQGSCLIYETGDDLEENMVMQYNLNLDKTLDSFPTPITNGSVLAVEDFQQEFTCSLHIKHRDSFDEEKEPDNMVLLGKLPSPTVREWNTESAKTGEPENDDDLIATEKDDDEVVIVNAVMKAGTKRKLTVEETGQADMLPVEKRQKLTSALL